MQLQQRIDFAKETAIKAGNLLLEIFENYANIASETKSVNDIVTEGDTKSENLIVRAIQAAFPDDLVVSEEVNGDKESDLLEHDGFVWSIDPLDGTRNFSLGNPNFAVSIGIIDQDKQMNGVIYFPILKQMFEANDGKAYLNGREIKVNPTTELNKALVAYGDKREKDPNYQGIDILNSLRGKVKLIRVFGASALEKAWVANGQLDIFACNTSSVFGAVAGVGLIRYAGGIVWNLKGEEWKLGDVGIICGSPEVVKKAFGELE